METKLFKGVRCLTQQQYTILKRDGFIVVDGETITYDKDFVYVTPEDVSETVREHTAVIAQNTEDITSNKNNISINANEIAALKTITSDQNSEIVTLKNNISEIIVRDTTQDNRLTNIEENFATKEYVAENGGKIDKIAVNGVDQEIVDKRVNISIPDVGDLSNVVTLDSAQTITGPKTFTEHIYLANVDGTVDRISHINNNFIIHSGATNSAVLNIDEGLSKIYAFNNELAFKSDIAEASGTTVYVNNTAVADLRFDSDPQTQITLISTELEDNHYTKSEVDALFGGSGENLLQVTPLVFQGGTINPGDDDSKILTNEAGEDYSLGLVAGKQYVIGYEIEGVPYTVTTLALDGATIGSVGVVLITSGLKHGEYSDIAIACVDVADFGMTQVVASRDTTTPFEKPEITITSISEQSQRYVPSTRSVNNKSLSSDIVLNMDDIPELTTTLTNFETDMDIIRNNLSNTIPPHRTINGKPLTEDVVLTPADIGLGTAFNLKGSKETLTDLPTEGNTIGDVWYVVSEEVGYIWLDDGSGERWERFGAPIDLSGYLPSAGGTITGDLAVDGAISEGGTVLSDKYALKSAVPTENELIKEIKTQYIRITDLETGVYKLTYYGTKYIYYSGKTSTATHTVNVGTGAAILTISRYSSTVWNWFYLGGSGTTRTVLYGGATSASSGSYSSMNIAPVGTTTGVTSGSTLPVTSGGVYTHLQNIGAKGQLTTQYVRVTDLQSGMYYWSYNGTKHLYYNGETDTATLDFSARNSGPLMLMVSDVGDYTVWYTIAIGEYLGAFVTQYIPYLYYGRTTATSGSVDGIRLSGVLDAGSTDYVMESVTQPLTSKGAYNNTSRVTLNGESLRDPSFYAPVETGTAGQILQSNGEGVAPTWMDVPASGFSRTLLWSGNISMSTGATTQSASLSETIAIGDYIEIEYYYKDGGVNCSRYKIRAFGGGQSGGQVYLTETAGLSAGNLRFQSTIATPNTSTMSFNGPFSSVSNTGTSSSTTITITAIYKITQ